MFFTTYNALIINNIQNDFFDPQKPPFSKQ